jgi:hypothetical protein
LTPAAIRREQPPGDHAMNDNPQLGLGGIIAKLRARRAAAQQPLLRMGDHWWPQPMARAERTAVASPLLAAAE